MSSIFQDWIVNRGNIKGRLVLLAFRVSSNIYKLPFYSKWIFLPYVVLYRLIVEWILGIELPWKLTVGTNLRLFHGTALVINDKVVIGSNCIVRHATTIGVSTTSFSFDGDAPVIGDNVDIGCNVVILGKVIVGSGAIIGAGSVVVGDVPKNAVVVGNPARVIRYKDVYAATSNA